MCFLFLNKTRMKFRLSLVLFAVILALYTALAQDDVEAPVVARKKIIRRVLIPASGERKTISPDDRRAHLVRVRTQRVPLSRDDRKTKEIDKHDLQLPDDNVATAAESPPTVVEGEEKKKKNGKKFKIKELERYKHWKRHPSSSSSPGASRTETVFFFVEKTSKLLQIIIAKFRDNY